MVQLLIVRGNVLKVKILPLLLFVLAVEEVVILPLIVKLICEYEMCLFSSNFDIFLLTPPSLSLSFIRSGNSGPLTVTDRAKMDSEVILIIVVIATFLPHVFSQYQSLMKELGETVPETAGGTQVPPPASLVCSTSTCIV